MDRLSAHKTFAQLIKNHGYSVTNVRKTVFDAMLHREPQFLHEILERIGSAADRASVYRTIDLFEKLGIAQRLPIGWKYKLELTDLFSEHHHHLTCVSCGTVTAIAESNDLEKLIHTLAEQAGYLPESHQVEIRGICAGCRNVLKRQQK